MAKWILLLSVTVLTRTGMADILVQPGYQPQQHHSIITQPPETMQHKDQQLKSADYHLEFHPVYTDSYHVPADALHPLLQHYQLIPQNYNQLNPGQISDLGIMGMPVPASPEYAPSPVHSRNRRSIEPNVSGTRQKRDNPDAVATKSSLDENISPVIDLQSLDGESTKGLDEKNVKVRQSGNQQPMTDSLLGLNPSNMYPTYQEYRVMEPALDSNQEITSKQTPSETNAEETVLTQAASQYPEVSSTPIQPSQIKLENLQHAMLLQQPAPQQHQEVSRGMEQRNFPDPRPSSATSQSPEADMPNHNHPRSATHGTKVYGLSKTNKLMIGNYGGLHHAKLVKGHHSHAVMSTFKQASDRSDPSGDSNTHQDDATSNNLAGNSGQQVVQVYQLPNGQAISYLPSTQYTMLPQTYSSNYVVNYGSSNPCSPSSYRICVHTSGDEPIRMYQLP